MRRLRLAFDMSDRIWFEPYKTVDGQVDTNDVPVFYERFNMTIRVARMVQNGREFILYRAGEDPMPWERVFAVTVAILDNSSWNEAVQVAFDGVEVEAVGKAAVEVLRDDSV